MGTLFREVKPSTPIIHKCLQVLSLTNYINIIKSGQPLKPQHLPVTKNLPTCLHLQTAQLETMKEDSKRLKILPYYKDLNILKQVLPLLIEFMGLLFFIATGFHGLHVLIGTLFLIVILFRHINYEFSIAHHFGFEAAA